MSKQQKMSVFQKTDYCFANIPDFHTFIAQTNIFLETIVHVLAQRLSFKKTQPFHSEFYQNTEF